MSYTDALIPPRKRKLQLTMNENYSNPWQTQSSRQIYHNPWIEVREDAVIQPDGAPGIYGVVHMRNKAGAVVPIDAEGCIYLVGQYRYTLNLYSWEIPEGGCPPDEDTEAAARRELLEETGLQAATWQTPGKAHLSNSVTDEEALLYLATDLTQGATQPEGTEDLQIKRVPFEAALQMVLSGAITDGLSIIGITRYALMQAVNN